MLNINLFAGPSAGKSTTAAGLFFELKKHNANAEYVQEYAKDLVYAKDYTHLSDQLHVIAEQHHRMFRIGSNVDYLIHDSPFLLGLVYLEDDGHLPKKEFIDLVIKLFKSYKSLNIFLERNEEIPFQTFGRRHDETQSLKKDKEILKMLDEHNIEYFKVKMNNRSINKIIDILKDHT